MPSPALPSLAPSFNKGYEICTNNANILGSKILKGNLVLIHLGYKNGKDHNEKFHLVLVQKGGKALVVFAIFVRIFKHSA